MNATMTEEGSKKNFLTETEMDALLNAAQRGRHGRRDYLLVLMAYRHGFRVSELIDVRMADLDLDTRRIFVRRNKGCLSTRQPVEGDELRDRCVRRFNFRKPFQNPSEKRQSAAWVVKRGKRRNRRQSVKRWAL